MNISNPKIWSLTDGSQGMISQCRGLALELGSDIKEIKTDILFPWNKLQPGFLPIYRWIFINKIPKIIPDIVISCGRKSVYLSIFLKRKFPKIINIHIQNPKISSKEFSFVIAPNHDNIKGYNIINSIGALHHFKNSRKTIENNINVSTKKELITCIIGGQNNHYLFSKKEAYNLCQKIKKLKEKNRELEFLVITSRRTNIDTKKIIHDELASVSRLWLGEGQNPYEYAIFNSRFFIITSDSTSMISEAAISGMPIYVFELPFKRKSLRIERFHKEFKKLNITKDLNSSNILDKWTYNKLDESKRIAGIIKKRIIQGINESN